MTRLPQGSTDRSDDGGAVVGRPARRGDVDADTIATALRIPGLDAARTRLGFALRQYDRLLRDRIGRQAGEVDTALVVHDFVTYGLGFHAAEIAAVHDVDGDAPVLTPVSCLSVGTVPVALLEVVRCCAQPGDRHARNLRSAASTRGVEWAIVTNGSIWQLHHVAGHDGVLAFEIDVLAGLPTDQAAAALALVSRESCATQVLSQFSSSLFA
jgi:hypothetical protein